MRRIDRGRSETRGYFGGGFCRAAVDDDGTRARLRLRFRTRFARRPDGRHASEEFSGFHRNLERGGKACRVSRGNWRKIQLRKDSLPARLAIVPELVRAVTGFARAAGPLFR